MHPWDDPAAAQHQPPASGTTNTAAGPPTAQSIPPASAQMPVGQRSSSSPEASSSGHSTQGAPGGQSDSEDQQYNLGVRLALRALSFYRNVLSPLMPPRCRYTPSCSNYSIQAFKEFGVWKGGALTAWRLARCQPLGGKAWSYDPPAWPPVGLEFMYGDVYVVWLVATNVSVVAAAYFLKEIGFTLW